MDNELFSKIYKEIPMNQPIKVALLGATGKAGKYILRELLNQKLAVKALIRQPETFSISNPLLEIVKGDIRDLETARLLLQDCALIISAIGSKKDEPLVQSLATTNILKAMDEFQIRRYILLAGLNVDVPGDQKSEANQMSTNWMRQTFPEAVADRQLAYEILSNSKTDWTFVRLPWIEQTEERRGITVNLQDCKGEKISTSDLADFLIEQISDTNYLRKAPFVASL